MPTYVVLYRFTNDGARGIRDTVKRAGAIRQENARRGFNVREVFWTQGPYDMVAVVDAPSEESMMGAMMNVAAAGNVTSTTMRAFEATDMSRIMAQMPAEPARRRRAAAKAPARRPAKK